MHWEIQSILKNKINPQRRREIITKVLAGRGALSGKKIREFLNPPLPEKLSAQKLGINLSALSQALRRVDYAVENNQPIIIYGDYDADGICATAIIWETLNSLGAKVKPFIPQREKHGYGLSIKGLSELLAGSKATLSDPPPQLIITVDNGIVAFEAAEFLNQQGIDLIITDHHQKTNRLPRAHSIVHTTQLAGSGVAWIFAKEILKRHHSAYSAAQSLDLAALGSVADMVPLLGPNRSLVKHGLLKLKNTSRVGLVRIYEEAAIVPETIDTYHINFFIAPRLNAMGRLDHALDSLRLLCTKNQTRAAALASNLGKINRERQALTENMLQMADKLYLKTLEKPQSGKIIIIDHQDFHEGIIGLVAGKLVETYYLPAVVIARGKNISKASARSISGFNIIKAIRKTGKLLIDAGGHPMAAGFSIESKNIDKFKTALRRIAGKLISARMLQRKITASCELELSDLNWQLFRALEKLKPFGIGNPRPKFVLRNIEILESRRIGADGKHLKLFLPASTRPQTFLPALWFNHGDLAISTGGKIDLAFSLSENVWQGKQELQLIIDDLAVTSSGN